MTRQGLLSPDGDMERRIRALLTSRMSELTARIARIESEQRQSVDDDSAEQAIEREDDESLDAIERAALSEIDEIKRALGRLGDGSYGHCVSCGEEIDPRRLTAMPAAAVCMICATAAGS
jgi:RNA polymerase-binding transcription factor DksA